MSRAKALVAARIACAVISGVACLAGESSNLEPRTERNKQSPKLTLPSALIDEIERSFPRFRLPGEKEIIGEWGPGKGFPYAVWGDFDGNVRIPVMVNTWSGGR